MTSSEQTAPKCCWTTLLTTEAYVNGTLTLAFSLKKHNSQYPLVVMWADSLSQSGLETIKKAGLETIQVDHLRPHTAVDFGVDTRFYDCWTKLQGFSLYKYGYDRVVQLDSDMLILRNMDELMTIPLRNDQIAACHACVCNPRKLAHYPKDWVPENCAYTGIVHPDGSTIESAPNSQSGLKILNGGLQVCRPTETYYNKILEILNHSPEINNFKFADQSLLSFVFAGSNWIALPYIYNALKTLRTIHEKMWVDKDIKNIHYILDKPWDPPRTGEDETHDWWRRVDEERISSITQEA